MAQGSWEGFLRGVLLVQLEGESGVMDSCDLAYPEGEILAEDSDKAVAFESQSSPVRVLYLFVGCEVLKRECGGVLRDGGPFNVSKEVCCLGGLFGAEFCLCGVFPSLGGASSGDLFEVLKCLRMCLCRGLSSVVYVEVCKVVEQEFVEEEGLGLVVLVGYEEPPLGLVGRAELVCTVDDMVGVFGCLRPVL